MLKFVDLSVALAWNEKHFVLCKENGSNKKIVKSI